MTDTELECRHRWLDAAIAFYIDAIRELTASWRSTAG